MSSEKIAKINKLRWHYMDLYPHQHRIVDHIKEHPKCGIFVEMGMGKTVSTLKAIVELAAEGKIEDGHILVVAPMRVAQHVWNHEFVQWEKVLFLKRNTQRKRSEFRVLVGPKGYRERQLKDMIRNDGPGALCTINRENIPWLCKYLEDRDIPWPFQMVVLDESQSFKNSSSKRWKCLRRHIHKSERVVLLSGTPAPNGLEDLWAQMYLLDQGDRLGRAYQPFLNRYFNHISKPWARYGKWKPKRKSEAEILGLIEDICISMKAGDHFDTNMNEPFVSDVYAYMNLDEENKYLELEKKGFLEFDEGKVKALHAGALANKLLQAAAGSMYIDDSGNYATLHNKKAEVLEEILEGLQENAIISYTYRKDKEKIIQVVKNSGRSFACLGERQGNSDTIIRDWNKGKIQCLIMHPASAGHGLNIQFGGRALIWYSLPWSLELYSQTNARIYGGHRNKGEMVRIFRIITFNTYDERVSEVLADKDSTQKTLMDSLSEEKLL